MAFKRLPVVRKLFKEHTPKIAFRAISKFSRSSAPQGGDRGVFAAGTLAWAAVNTIDYVAISTTDDATDFGDLTQSIGSASSNGYLDRGIVAGRGQSDNSIDYITISSTGNSQDFGDTLVGGSQKAATSNGSNDRGIFAGGFSGSAINNIDFVTISSTGNAQDFGDITVTTEGADATSNAANNRGLIAGGRSGAPVVNTIEYITINSIGNATNFGDLTVVSCQFPAGCSNGTNNRGIFGGGQTTSTVKINTISFVTITTLGNAQDFGDLSQPLSFMKSTSNGLSDRGIFVGGLSGAVVTTYTPVNTIDYVTISTTGNAQNIGNLTQARGQAASCSNA